MAALLGACSAADVRSIRGAGSGAGGRAPAVGAASAGAALQDDASAGGAHSAAGANDSADAGTSASGASDAVAGDAGASAEAGAPSAGGDASVGGSSGATAGQVGAGADVGAAGMGGADAGGAANAGGAAGNPNLGLMIPCAVSAVYTVCHTCHRDPPVNGAPFPLVSLGQVQSNTELQINDVSAGIMPLGAILPEAQKKTLLDWLMAGAQGVPQGPCP